MLTGVDIPLQTSKSCKRVEKALFCVTRDNLKVALAASVLKSQKSSDNQTLEILQDA